jgi:hypothetical protein
MRGCHNTVYMITMILEEPTVPIFNPEIYEALPVWKPEIFEMAYVFGENSLLVLSMFGLVFECVLVLKRVM